MTAPIGVLRDARDLPDATVAASGARATTAGSAAPAAAPPLTPAAAASRAPAAPARDLRVDFIRGWVMLILIVNHTEFFSLWNLVVWERVGVISGGTGFVLLSGLVLGMVSRGRLERDGLRAAAARLIDRGFQLYRVILAICAAVAALYLALGPAVDEITTFTDRGSGAVYPMYPGPGASILQWIGSLVTLRLGPHQTQVLGLYVCLLVLAPLALWLLHVGRTRALLVASWILYFTNALSPRMPTGAQFEYGFPLLTWQVLFVHGLAAGYHGGRLRAFFATRAGRWTLAACAVIAAAFAVFAQGTTNPLLPAWARFDLWPAFYTHVWQRWCMKNTLGLLRLVDYAAFLVVAYALLTRFWRLLSRALGWYLVPIGQATLYVFIVHVFVLAGVAQIVPFGFPRDLGAVEILRNTLLHTGELALMWLLVRYRVLFRWIPR